jgi:hypothetical protein
MDLLGIMSEGFNVTDLILIILLAFVRYWKNVSIMREHINYSWTSRIPKIQ